MPDTRPAQVVVPGPVPLPVIACATCAQTFPTFPALLAHLPACNPARLQELRQGLASLVFHNGSELCQSP